MSPEEPTGSSVARRSIGVEVRRLREAAGVTVDGAAKYAEMSRQTLWKIELGHPRVRVRNKDLEVLCNLYSATDETRAGLLHLADITRVKGWYSSFADLLPSGFDMYVGLEEHASTVSTYEMMLVPGLLQTADYARVMISTVTERDPDEIERRVMMRMRRQQILTRSNPRPTCLEVVLNEAVLHRQIGSASVMSAQLQHINTLAQLPTVSVQVLPFTTSTRTDILAGPFVVLQFPPKAGPAIAYVDGFIEAHGASYYDKREEIERYEAAFDDIRKAALDEQLSREFIARQAKEFDRA